MSYFSSFFFSSTSSKCLTVPTDTPPPERLARPPPPAPGCPFSSSGPVFLFAFFLSPKQHWDAFQRWHDTFFAPPPPSCQAPLSDSIPVPELRYAHSLKHFSHFHLDTTRAPFAAHILAPRTPEHGGGLAWFLFVSPRSSSTIVQHPPFFFISSSDCNCDRFSCAPLLRRGRRPASYFPPSATAVLLAAVVA